MYIYADIQQPAWRRKCRQLYICSRTQAGIPAVCLHIYKLAYVCIYIGCCMSAYIYIYMYTAIYVAVRRQPYIYI